VSKINVYLPDDLAEAVKEAGLPVSAICQRALEQAVRRVSAIRETAMSALDIADHAGRFSHFTRRARTVVQLAAEQARAAGETEISTGHLLGGILAEGGNLALHVLPAMEIEPGQLQRELDRRTAQGSAAPGGPGTVTSREPQPSGPQPPAGPDEAAPMAAAGTDGSGPGFSESAVAALQLTITEAAALGHNYIGCEHLLLGLIAEPDGSAGRILRSQGAEIRLTRRSVAAALVGYAHLSTQHAAGGGPAAQVTADGLAAAIRQELQPLAQRVERLEQRLGPAA
jgi:ATP-dependent Clp protease ATP-binding subunit ClpA/post-segregation antitoxin (ccd killing protein)